MRSNHYLIDFSKIKYTLDVDKRIIADMKSLLEQKMERPTVEFLGSGETSAVIDMALYRLGSL